MTADIPPANAGKPIKMRRAFWKPFTLVLFVAWWFMAAWDWIYSIEPPYPANLAGLFIRAVKHVSREIRLEGAGWYSLALCTAAGVVLALWRGWSPTESMTWVRLVAFWSANVVVFESVLMVLSPITIWEQTTGFFSLPNIYTEVVAIVAFALSGGALLAARARGEPVS